MAEVVVRRARPDDMETLLKFEQSLIEAERPFDPTIRSGTDVRYYDLAELLVSPHAELVVAEIDAQIVGCGYARIKPASDYLKHPNYSYLGFMYVVPEHRGRGINREIITVLEEWSLSRGVTEMRLEVYAENGAAIRAYEKSGYASLTLTMRKAIGQ
jgi:ribosomal protein S18 acetylase RimI-like enzyme